MAVTAAKLSRKYVAVASLSLLTVCSFLIYSKLLSTSCCGKMYKDCLACLNGTSVDAFCFDYPGQFGCGYRIMFAMIVSEKRGYVRFAANVMKRYNKVNSRDLLIYDNNSFGFNSYTLHKWFGDANVTRTDERLGTAYSQILNIFLNSKYDVLFLANPNIILHKKYKDFIDEYIMDSDGLLWLYNPSNLPKRCEGGICEVKSCGRFEIAMTKPVAERLLKIQGTQTSNNFEETLRKNGVRIMIPETSLVVRFGREDAKTSCTQKDIPYNLSLCNFPQWIQDGYNFYQERCYDAEEFYVQFDSLPRSIKTENFHIAFIILTISMKDTEACLESIIGTSEASYMYTIYVGLNGNIDSLRNRKQLKKYSVNNSSIRCLAIVGKTDAESMNFIFRKAYSDGNDYFIFTRDTIIFKSQKGVTKAIDALGNNLPINVGMVTPSCEACDPSMLPVVISRLHYDIFGFLFPMQLTQNQGKSWMRMVYSSQHSLKLEDWIVEKQGSSKMTLVENDSEKELNDLVLIAQSKFKKWLRPVVAFSLYGSSIRYTDGAIANMKLMPKFFLEWQMWVYHDDSVPEKILKRLCENDVKLIDMTNSPIKNQMSWRFLPASDPVTRFIVRDIDSRLSRRDKAAVDEWVASDKKFHVVRDHPNHAVWAMNGGMWGATGDAIPNLKSLLLAKNPSGAYIQDMNFLCDVVWKYAKHSVMQHDEISNGKFGETRPFPLKPEGTEYVGDVYWSGQ